jgi:hypothetical protein
MGDIIVINLVIEVALQESMKQHVPWHHEVQEPFADDPWVFNTPQVHEGVALDTLNQVIPIYGIGAESVEARAVNEVISTTQRGEGPRVVLEKENVDAPIIQDDVTIGVT